MSKEPGPVMARHGRNTAKPGGWIRRVMKEQRR